MDIVSVINRPQRDDLMIKTAGIPLERALFPLVAIERLGPIGVVDLAEQIGRDYMRKFADAFSKEPKAKA